MVDCMFICINVSAVFCIAIDGLFVFTEYICMIVFAFASWLHVYVYKCGPGGIPPPLLLYCDCQGYLLSLHCIGALDHSSPAFKNILRRNETYVFFGQW